MLSVITGGGKWVEIKTHADPLYQHLIITAERKFWRCVESGEPPALFGIEPPTPRIAAVRIVDMNASNAWAEFAAVFARTRSAHLEHEQAKAELKGSGARGCPTGDRAWRPRQTLKVRCRQLRSSWLRMLAVQRTSETIGTLAAALAKAQLALHQSGKITNRNYPQGPAEPEQTFRYALVRPAGLRSCAKPWVIMRLPHVQTTSIDQAAGIVQLTTVLAHSSGEWIASDWPVCPISDTATPHRMGEALTYTRRYGLFTLVGIAGEDDRDAPNVATPPPTSNSYRKSRQAMEVAATSMVAASLSRSRAKAAEQPFSLGRIGGITRSACCRT